MSFFDGFIGSSNIISCLCTSSVQVVGLNRFVWQGVRHMCHKLCRSNVGPLGEHFGGNQSLKTFGYYHWVLSLATRLCIYRVFLGLFACSKFPYPKK